VAKSLQWTAFLSSASRDFAHAVLAAPFDSVGKNRW
jgi:hypothetical protein